MLMEAAPAGVDVDGVGAAICREEGVRSVHDLHVWTVTSGFGAIAAHVVVAQGTDRDLIRRRLELILREPTGSSTRRCRWRRRRARSSSTSRTSPSS